MRPFSFRIRQMLTGSTLLAAFLPWVVHAADWKSDQIADALRAAPPNVTYNAKIHAWEGTKRVLVRDGDGPYTCVASGSYSLRLGKPPLPYPDSFCADQNAWLFIEAFWAEPDPMKPSKSLPRAPGIVWMLAGMNVVRGKVAYSHDDKSHVQTGHHGMAPSGALSKKEDIINMTPHIMILPLPLDPKASQLSGAYDPHHPLAMWIMAPGTPIAHLHVHFPDTVHQTLMTIPPPSP